MALRCAWCGSVETMAGLDEYQCLACGKNTKATGEKALHLTTPSDPIKTVVSDDEGVEPPGQNSDRRRRPGDPEPMPEQGVEEEPPVAPAPKSTDTDTVALQQAVTASAQSTVNLSEQAEEALKPPTPAEEALAKAQADLAAAQAALRGT